MSLTVNDLIFSCRANAAIAVQCVGRKRRFVNEDPVTGETSDDLVQTIDATQSR